MVKESADLSAQDVEFLQAVRHIQLNPDEYPAAAESDVPVITSALKTVLMNEWDTVTEWSNTMVDYRMSEGDRGWGEDGLGLVKLHEADYNDETMEWTDRGIELTDKGFSRLSSMEERLSMSREEASTSGQMGGLDSSAEEVALEVDGLRSEMEELSEQVSELREVVERFEELETGALDPQVASQVRTIFDRVVSHQQILANVFEIDPSRYSPNSDTEVTRDVISDSRGSLRQALNATVDEGSPEADGDADRGEQGG